MVINGVDASSIGTGSTPNLAVPATDSIQEFIVSTNLYDASLGRNAGSVVSAVTKSGSNEIHGNVYEFFRNTMLDANNFFLNRADIPRPAYQRNQFGATVGGPIVKDRAWFFVSYQGTREKNGTSLTNSIGTVFVPGNLTNNRSTAALDTLAASYGLQGIDPTALTPAGHAAEWGLCDSVRAAPNQFQRCRGNAGRWALVFQRKPVQHKPRFSTDLVRPALGKVLLGRQSRDPGPIQRIRTGKRAAHSRIWRVYQFQSAGPRY